MSISQETPSASLVRGWTTEDVVLALRQNGLEDAVPSFRKRNIDGNAFLKLTEIQLKVNWNHDLSFSSVWKISKLISDIKAQPEKNTFSFGQPLKFHPVPLPAKLGDKPKLKVKPQPPATSPGKSQGRHGDAELGLKLPPPLPSTIQASWRDPTPATPSLANRPLPSTPVPSVKSLVDRCPALSPPVSPGRWRRDAAVGPPTAALSPSTSQATVWNRDRKPKPPPSPLQVQESTVMFTETEVSVISQENGRSTVTMEDSAGGKEKEAETINRAQLEGASSDIGRHGDAGLGPKLPPPLPSTVQASWRDPTPATPSLGHRPLPSTPVPSVKSFVDRCPALSLPVSPWNWRRDDAAGPPTAALSPSTSPATVWNRDRKPKPPPLLNKPKISPAVGRICISGDNSPLDEKPSEPMGVLAQQLANALQLRKQTAQQNGRLPVNLEPRRPAPKPPVLPAAVPPPTKPAYLPMPPPMPTGQEDEHIMEIVSSIQIPSVTSEVRVVVDSEGESYLNSMNAVDDGEELYEEPPDFPAPEASVDETPEDSSDIYEYIGEERLEYYVEPTGAGNPSAQAEFESTHSLVKDLPLAPSVPTKSYGGGFMSSLKASLFRSSRPKSPEDRQSKYKRGRKDVRGRSCSPGKEKLTVTSELRKSPTSSTTSLISPNKGNAGQTPDQRLPPNLRPLPPTPGVVPFRPVPPNSTSTISRKNASSKIPLGQQPWYHNVDRRRGEELVCNREDGTFLIRPSTQNQNPYTLTIWYGNRVYNIAVRYRSDQKYALGSEKPNEQSFRSLEEMVNFYQTEQLVLFSGGERAGQTSLKSSP